MGSNIIWTPERTEAARMRYERGDTARAVAYSLGVTEGQARHIARILGFDTGPHPNEKGAGNWPKRDDEGWPTTWRLRDEPGRFEDVPPEELKRRDTARTGKRVVGAWPVAEAASLGNAAAMCAGL